MKMKRRSLRIISLIFTMIFLIGVTAVKAFAAPPASMTNYEFKTVAQTMEYGSDVIAVMIDMGKNIDPSTINTDTFSVSTTNLRLDGTTVMYNGPRKVMDAYVNNTQKVGDKSPNGRYIILELEHGFTVLGATTMYYSGRNYLLTMNYVVTQNSSFKYTNDTIIKSGETTYAKAGEINLVADDFAKLTETSATGASTNYRLFTPEDTSIAQPLMLFLHGAGENGTNNEAQVRANKGATSWAERSWQKKHPCYVMAPQGSWNSTNFDNIYNVIQKLVAEGKVDKNRIYIGGVSMGGGGTINMLIRYPNLFAAAIPNCPAAFLSSTNAALLVNQPIWLVTAANDPTVRIANVNTIYDTMVAAGVNVYYTVFPDVVTPLGTYNGHWSWIYTYNNFVDPGVELRGPIMNWLFSNVKQ